MLGKGLVAGACSVLVASLVYPVSAHATPVTLDDFSTAAASFLTAAERTSLAAEAGVDVRTNFFDPADPESFNIFTRARTSLDRPSRVSVTYVRGGVSTVAVTQGSFEYSKAPGTFKAFVSLPPASRFDRVQLSKLSSSAKYSIGSVPQFPSWSPYTSYGFTSSQILQTLNASVSLPWSMSTLIAECNLEQVFVPVTCSGSTEVVDGLRTWSFEVSREDPAPTLTRFTLYSNEEGLVYKLVADGVAPSYTFTSEVSFTAAGAALPVFSRGRSVSSPRLTTAVAAAGARKWARTVREAVLSELAARGLPVDVRNVRKVLSDVDVDFMVPASAWLADGQWKVTQRGVRFNVFASDSISVSEGAAELKVVAGKVTLSSSAKLRYPDSGGLAPSLSPGEFTSPGAALLPGVR